VVCTACLCVIASAARVNAHASGRGLVLLLPTDIYSAFGVAAVAATVVLTALLPASLVSRIFRTDEGTDSGQFAPPVPAQIVVSTLSFLVLVLLVSLGFWGVHDPLENPLPLVIFTAWWVFAPLVQATFGDVWRWTNPWIGPVYLIFAGRKFRTLPDRVGVWPAVLVIFAGGIFALTDIAPDDPSKLAVIVATYWVATLLLCSVFGPQWLARGEGFSVFLGLVARLSPIRLGRTWMRFPGHRLVGAPSFGPSMAVFSVMLLAIGSFDGLDETFWWLGHLGVNPLAFSGRSGVVWQNRIGLVGSVVLLNLIFAACVWLGLALVHRRALFVGLYPKLALSILPIAMGYHFAHFLTSTLVNSQYLIKALNDPFETGAGFLGLPDFYVTTSFFNQHQTVQAIWLAQAGAIVVAHMLALVLSHAIALRALDSHRATVISQMPVATFMVLYTFFGLWLLASPVIG